MLTYPEIDPVIFSIGPLAVRWYGLMYVIGFAAAWFLATRRAQQGWSVIRPNNVDDLIFYGVLGVILGGRLGYSLFYGMKYVIADPLYVVKIWEGGMSFHGGLIGVMIAMWLYGRQSRAHDVADDGFRRAAGADRSRHGRVGNFINGELWGKETTVPWAFDRQRGRAAPVAALRGVARGRWCCSSSSGSTRQDRGRPWPCRACSCSVTASFRFSSSSTGCPTQHIGYLAFGWVTMGQVLSLPMIVAGVVLLVWPTAGQRSGQSRA